MMVPQVLLKEHGFGLGLLVYSNEPVGFVV